MTTPAEELRAAADKLAPEPEARPKLTGDYPDLDACYADLLRTTADTYDAATRAMPSPPTEDAYWLAPALAAARKINGASR